MSPHPHQGELVLPVHTAGDQYASSSSAGTSAASSSRAGSPTSPTSSTASSNTFPFLSSKSGYHAGSNGIRQRGLRGYIQRVVAVMAAAIRGLVQMIPLPPRLRIVFLAGICFLIVLGLSGPRTLRSHYPWRASSPTTFEDVEAEYSPSSSEDGRLGPENPTLRIRRPLHIPYTDGSVDIEAPVPWYKTSLLARLAALEGKWLGTAAYAGKGLGDWEGRGDVVGELELEGISKKGRGSKGLESKELEVSGLPVFPRKAVLPRGAPEAQDLMFGMATNAKRTDKISLLWPHWLGPQTYPPPSLSRDSASVASYYSSNDTARLPSCLVLLPSEDFKPLDGRHASTSKAHHLHRALSLPSRGLGHCKLRRTTLPHTERYEVRYFALVREMKRLAEEQGRDPMWWIVGDDDTFWVDQRTLRRELGMYDADQKWFIGGNTEARNQYDTFGTMAYGGAGIIMSRGLFNAMNDMYDECIDRLKDTFGGDGIYTRCAAMAMGEGATPESAVTSHPGLHQMDVPGDGTGFFQSGLPFVSLHHMWNGWTDAFAATHPTPGIDFGDSDINQLMLITRAARFLGGDNLFKRFVFGDGRELVTLGYSVTLFEEPMVKEDLTVLEYTWSYDEYRLLWPHRPRIIESMTGSELPSGQRGKDTYYLSEVILADAPSPAHAPTRAVLRHTDRWGRHVDVVWENDPVPEGDYAPEDEERRSGRGRGKRPRGAERRKVWDGRGEDGQAVTTRTAGEDRERERDGWQQ